MPVTPDALDHALLGLLGQGLPLVERPFKALGDILEISEQEVLERLARLSAAKVITRFGLMVDLEAAGVASLLAAMRVPEERFGEVARQVTAHDVVMHATRREHALNLWLVLGAAGPEAIDETLAAIEAQTGLPVFRLPKTTVFGKVVREVA